MKPFPGTIDPLELARMFPTPPSMESQPTCSPLEIVQINDQPLEMEEPLVFGLSSHSALKEHLHPSHPISLTKYAPVKDTPGSMIVFPSSTERFVYRPVWVMQPRFQHAPVSSRLIRPRTGQISRSSSQVKSPRMPVFSPVSFGHMANQSGMYSATHKRGTMRAAYVTGV